MIEQLKKIDETILKTIETRKQKKALKDEKASLLKRIDEIDTILERDFSTHWGVPDDDGASEILREYIDGRFKELSV